ncbi:MAG: 1-(5-phosphoribosyl)-5-[(5-phosphoribosylamino)methylideneamino]imidazole-4-carboxamide isomerase [Limnochordia bacterium]|nr:1-(5-phosphoribosyl)-5-[(5-phosphoribosylamino)methylideneamino]imidazole-4-carboxamide isomerase [Limnochordia bacterium]MDD4518347.1 1-(5-phosphoribosyl)-5-[(5-phosphoribosylamino)methylideneamino]imidazole-4-carboxamide isomerase [Limnochordia bacterium]
MQVIPAIDLREGKCVRLLQGDPNQQTTYSDDPLSVAREFEVAGAALLHVVDLDGAFSGSSKNLTVIEAIAEEISIPIQVGGGIRSLQAIRRVLDTGASRVILGTIAQRQPELVGEACQLYGERIVVGIDAKDGQVAVSGWQEGTDVSAYELGLSMKNLGVKTIIFTDIARDGMLTGPNYQSLEEMLKLGVSIIASGGVSSLDDLMRLAQLASQGLVGAIVGKALYDGRFDLQSAIALIQQSKKQ